MAGRYTGWHARAGDVNASPALRDLGKKLLGEMQQALQAGHSPPLVRRVTLPDGSSVTASMIAGIPRLEFMPPTVAAPTQQPFWIEGFIVRPSPEGDQDENADHNHVLLLFGSTYKPTFADAAHIPEWLSAGTYTRTFPDGLDYGNVDWRNDDLHMQVNWLGPNGRYFGATEGAYGGPIVWCKGRVLFDTREDYAGDLGILEYAVEGACLRRNSGLWLYVVVRDNTHEKLVRFRIRSARDRALMLQKGVVIEEHLFADLVLVPDSGELLVSQTIPSNNGVHPWFFNASGTVAKRIDCTNGAAGNTEWTLTEAGDGSWSFSSVVHTSGRTISTVYSRSDELVGGQISVTATTDSGGLGVSTTNAYALQSLTYDSGPAVPGNWIYSNDWLSSPQTAGTVWMFASDPPNVSGVANAAQTGSNVRTDTRTQETLPAIVDFRGDEVVYGYGTVGAQTISNTRTLTEVSGSGSFVGTATDPLGNEVEWHTQFDFNETQSFAFNDASLTLNDGLTCDFLTVQAYDSSSNTGTESWESEVFREAGGGTDALGNPLTPIDDSNSRYTVTQNGTSVFEQVEIELHFIDLRYKHAYLHTKTFTQELATAGSVDSLVDSAGSVSYVGTIDQTNTQTTQTRARVIVGGVDVVDITDTSNSVSSGTIYDGTPAKFLYEISLSGFMAITTSGATEGYTEDAATGYYERTYSRSSGSSLTRGALVVGSAFQMRDTFDFHGSSLFTMGSIVSKGERWVYSLAGKDTPPGTEEPYYNALNAGDIDALTGNQPDVVRYYPVSYLPRTVIVR